MSSGPNEPAKSTAATPLTLTPKQLRALQLTALDIFHYLKAFCERHGLLVYFCGGCCIGALRDYGFIPWDDDVDVFMPRPDYERLTRLWEKHADTERYTLMRTDAQTVYGHSMTKVCDNHTTCVDAYQQGRDDIPHGVSIDILPLDAWPEGSFARRRQVVWAYLFSLFCTQTVPSRHGGLMTAGARILLGVVRSQRLRYRIWKTAEKRMTRTPFGTTEAVTELCSGPGYMRKRYPTSCFTSARPHRFEGADEPLPVDADTYLRIAFGDYTILPPPEQQTPHHDIVALDLTTPWRSQRMACE